MRLECCVLTSILDFRFQIANYGLFSLHKQFSFFANILIQLGFLKLLLIHILVDDIDGTSMLALFSFA